MPRSEWNSFAPLLNLPRASSELGMGWAPSALLSACSKIGTRAESALATALSFSSVRVRAEKRHCALSVRSVLRGARRRERFATVAYLVRQCTMAYSRLQPRINYFSVTAMRRISAGECSPASGVPGIRYFPIVSPPIRTGS